MLLWRHLAFLEETPGNVWPEFNKLGADHTFRGNCERPIYGLPKAPVRSRIVGIRNATGDKVAEHIRVVRPPGSVIAPAPNGGGSGVEKATGEWPRTETEVTRIFLKDDRQNRIASKIAIRSIEIRGPKALKVALSSLPESRIGVLRLAETGYKTVCNENEWINRAPVHQVELLSL